METIITRDVSIPRLGFGTFRMPGGGCEPVVESALALSHAWPGSKAEPRPPDPNPRRRRSANA